MRVLRACFSYDKRAADPPWLSLNSQKWMELRGQQRLMCKHTHGNTCTHIPQTLESWNHPESLFPHLEPNSKWEGRKSPQVPRLRVPPIIRGSASCPQALYGHTQAVTCLAASVTFSLLVSGSQDCTCILWDLDHLTHVARLPAHREGISALAISDVSVSPHFLNVNEPAWKRGAVSQKKTQEQREADLPRMLRNVVPNVWSILCPGRVEPSTCAASGSRFYFFLFYFSPSGW